jgi:hypothetical protein
LKPNGRRGFYIHLAIALSKKNYLTKTDTMTD